MEQPEFQRRHVDVPPLIEAKWSKTVAAEGFVPFPKRLLRCLPNVVRSLAELQVVLAIVDYARPKVTRQPSYEYLAFTAGMDVEDFKRIVEMMAERKLLRPREKGQGVEISLKGLLRRIEDATEEQDGEEQVDEGD